MKLYNYTNLIAASLSQAVESFVEACLISSVPIHFHQQKKICDHHYHAHLIDNLYVHQSPSITIIWQYLSSLVQRCEDLGNSNHYTFNCQFNEGLKSS